MAHTKQVIHKLYEEIRGCVQSRTALCPRLYPSSYPSGCRTSYHWHSQEHFVSFKKPSSSFVPIQRGLFGITLSPWSPTAKLERMVTTCFPQWYSGCEFNPTAIPTFLSLSKRTAFPVTGKSWLFLRATMRSDYLFRVFEMRMRRWKVIKHRMTCCLFPCLSTMRKPSVS